jgi:hypothetical protein
MPSGESPPILLLQTCDPQVYLPMLRCGRSINEYYAARWGMAYSSFVGIKRGYYPWQAAFNRVHLMKELIDGGFRGWVFYLDADAYVADLDFDLPALLQAHAHCAMIAGPGGEDGHQWDVNTGILMMNLGHPNGRRIVELWHADVMSTPESQLAAAASWHEVPSDQRRMHDVLIAHPELQADVSLMDRRLVNGWDSLFARQVLRVFAETLDERLAAMQAEISRILQEVDAPPPVEKSPPVARTLSPSSILTDELAACATVAILYRELLGRGADPGGLEFYAQRLLELGLAEGLNVIVAELVDSDEYRARTRSN